MTQDPSTPSLPSPQHRDSFARAFLPGLILGLVIGAAAGAFLPDVLASRPKLPEAPAGTRTHAAPRDERPEEPATPAEVTPAMPGKDAPNDQAGTKPQSPATKEPSPPAQATPPATSPK